MTSGNSKYSDNTVSKAGSRVKKKHTQTEGKRQNRSKAVEDVDFPVVGIGASAGGLAAFESFFSGMPVDTPPGMAFVLVQHLAPDHRSILTELIKRYTPMDVFEVTDGMKIEVNNVYIIPPNKDMALCGDSLRLYEPEAPRGHRFPIDFFFSSLAQDLHGRAICIILSGTGSDGIQGMRAVKAEGGIVMAQDPKSANFDGMPRSAIDTGLVDYQLAPEEMPAKLLAYVAQTFDNQYQPGAGADPCDESRLKKIFVLLRNQTGHDFSQYKSKTICRRIERRQAIRQIGSIDEYITVLQQNAAEIEALFRDLLIGVTSFFRDPEAFAMLEKKVVPALFSGKPGGSVIRVWSMGCATGEEAYSLAILLHEHMETLSRKFTVQVFATDIDSRAIETARAGLYPAGIATDISPQRLARYFTSEAESSLYRIDKRIREMLIFSEQDVIKDPPFSRIDLISCRNLLIYLSAELQKRLIPLFHYALNPGGHLFLGTSETVGEYGDLFATLDRKMKIYTCKEDSTVPQRQILGRFVSPAKTFHTVQPGLTTFAAIPGKMSLRVLTEQALLRQVAPIGALIDSHGDILYLHGRAGMFLEPTPGETGVNNILKMAREGLRAELVSALRQAVATKEPVHRTGILVKTNSEFTPANLSVCPLAPRPEIQDPGAAPSTSVEVSLFLVVIEDRTRSSGSGMAGRNANDEDTAADIGEKDEDNLATRKANALIAALRQELWAKEEYLQTANEELRSTNEEMQSVNEELQSTNEELETSKEEMQSINEELTTVNTELQTKVADLSRVNNDMNNLLAGTGIATVFVDHDLHILRFTPAATEIIHLIPSDIGRPVSHIVSNLVEYDQLVSDVTTVLVTLIAREIDVNTRAGKWYTLRIQPYRTLENVIEGAVITFIDISEAKKIKKMLHQTNTLFRLSVAGREEDDAVIIQDLKGRIISWNPGAERIYGWTRSEALTMNIHDMIPGELRHEALAKAQELSMAKSIAPYDSKRLHKDGTVLGVTITATALLDDEGTIYAIATQERSRAEKN
ncbi:chemotaxis protein CheB [Desulfogranum japonicum]|uniref:chemotaxis protein CheB n=1 Tax=Desulfogranum japonicum TaxID=231447 RepID=UPI000407D3F8|nr:chemotaxis protein CheB [Desulfogranum japonicum]